MCGIAGMWEFRGTADKDVLAGMCDTLSHRGPDDAGLFVDDESGVGLGHRRLSIIDLSAGGHQPMQRGDLTIVYNGEIYNFAEIKKDLEKHGVHFTSTSDTEVLLRAFEVWGKQAVQKFRGMFAFGIWDARNKKLLLCRDRAGVKPLYYYSDGQRFLFASELRALLRHPNVKKELNFGAVANYLQFGHIPSPLCILAHTSKLEPGYFLEVQPSGVIQKERYWDIADTVSTDVPGMLDDDSVLAHGEAILTEAFSLRTVADVPVGVFLSGGIDSSIVTALLQKEATVPLKTFTIGFEEEGYNEAEYAKRIAQHLGTEHHELYLSSRTSLDIVRRLPDLYDEPLADASAIPTFFVSQFARSNVKVALSADGGDELFCGYGERYTRIAQAYEKSAAFPAMAASIARLLVQSPIAQQSVRLKILASRGNIAEIFETLAKGGNKDTALRLLNHTVDPEYARTRWALFDSLKQFNILTQLQLFDFKTSMTDDMLTKVDRASMAVGLECREPFLDPAIIQYAMSLPPAFHRKDGEGKYVLRKILYKYVPRDLVDRPKHGFSAPVAEWLRKDLKPLVEEYLDEHRIQREGIFRPAIVAEEKQKFYAGKTGVAVLWNLLVFQMWKERWGL